MFFCSPLTNSKKRIGNKQNMSMSHNKLEIGKIEAYTSMDTNSLNK